MCSFSFQIYLPFFNFFQKYWLIVFLCGSLIYLLLPEKVQNLIKVKAVFLPWCYAIPLLLSICYSLQSYHIISHHIIPYHFISYHITSYHITSYHIISYHITSYHIISYHIISYHIISYHIISYHIISYHIISYQSYQQFIYSRKRN